MRKLFLFAVVALLFSACSKPDANALIAKGNDYMAKKLLPEAVVQYKLAVQADPQLGEARTKLADALLQQGDIRGGVHETIVAADLLPNDAAAQIKAGNLLLRGRAFEDASGRADKALAIDPKNSDALVLKGNALAGLKKLDNALDEYQEALALNPTGEQIYANIGIIQAVRGQTKEAEATFRKAVEMAPKAISAHLALAGFLWATGRAPEAETELKSALALEPENIQANQAIGGFYMATGRIPEAEAYYKAIAKADKTDRSKMALADYYLYSRRAEEAKTILTPLTLKPDSFGPASLRLAAIEVGRKNPSVATTIVRGVLDKTPNYAPARVFQLRLLIMDDKLDEAMTVATALVKDEPNSAAAGEASFLMGRIDAGRDRLGEAEKAYEEALRIQPQSTAIELALAQLHLHAGNPEKAEAFARQVLTAQPTSPVARVVVVRSFLMRGDTARAAQEMASLEKEFPNAAPVQNLLGARYLAGGNLVAARAMYAKAAATTPNDLEPLQGLVLVDLQAGRKKEATDEIEDALKRMPPSSDLYVLAARTHGAVGNLGRSEELLKKAIDREPARITAYGLLGQMYLVQNRLGDARDQYEQLVKRDPKSVPANTMLGMVYEAQKNVTGAEAQYKKTLGVDPAAAVAANNLAWLYVASNRNLDEAQQLAETALKGLPEEPHVNDTAGWIYYKKGMYRQAQRCLELSLKRDTSDPAVYYHLGMTYSQIGDFDKAKKSLQKALSMSQTFDGAKEAKKTLDDLR